MELKLSKYIVTLKSKLRWGDQEKINVAKGIVEDSGADKKQKNSTMDNPEMMKTMMKMLVANNSEAKYVAVECAVTLIKEGDNVIEFSRDWMDNLNQEDGNKLIEEVEKLKKNR